MTSPYYFRLIAGPVLGCLAFAFLAPIWPQETRKVSVESLIYDLKNPDEVRRKEAAIILGRERIRQAVPALIEATEDQDGLVRLEATRALVNINDSRALPAYIRLVEDSRRDIQSKAIEGIINIYVADEGGFIVGLKKVASFVNPFSDDYNPLVVEEYVPVSQEAIQALVRLLDSPNSSVRKEAATALGILRAATAVPELRESLGRETDNGVKVELIRAFYKIGEPRAATAVVPLIQDGDRKVRDEAIFTVGRLRVPEALDPLKELYESGQGDRRRILRVVPVSGADDLPRRLLEALAMLGDPSCRDLFLDALDDERESFRRFGAEGLGRMGERDLLQLLATRYHRERSESVKLALSYALYLLGREDHLIELVRSLDRGDQAMLYLLEMSADEIYKLQSPLRGARPSTQVKLLEVIGLRGDPSAIPLLEEISKSRNTEVVSAANLAMRRIHARYPAA